MRDHVRRIIIAVAVFGAATLAWQKWRENRGGYGLFDLLAGRKETAPARVAGPSAPGLRNLDLPGLAQFNEESAKLTAAVIPSVVSINIGSRAIVEKRDIFGFLRGYGTGVVATGLGSGVIVTKEGHIVTNHHVVKGAQQIQVTTNDHKTHPARLLGADTDLDIAVIQIDDGAGYPPLPFADSDSARVGELAFALGSPFGLDFTVSRGIVSATQRRLSETGNDYIQTDTIINPGNSGGPLINHRGEIIGINVSIYTDNQNAHAWQGVGLAVPANDAKDAFDAITGKRPRVSGYLGIEVDIGLIPSPYGTVYCAQVIDISPGSPAEKAGLERGDIIAQFNGTNFSSDRDFLRLIGRTKPGQTVALTVLRKDKPMTIQARIEAKPTGR